MKRFSWFAIFGRRQLGLLLAAAVATAALLAAASVGLPRLAASAPSEQRLLPIYCTDREGKVVSFTFDAAWGAEDTDRLLEIFDTYGIQVTFFVVGDWVEKFPEEVKKLHAAGHEVMNHSDTHPYMTKLTDEQRAAELNACNDKIEQLTGVRPTLFRPPYGDYSNAVIRSVEAAGMTCVQWSVDSLDWKDPSPEEMTKRVLSKVGSGDIVLFHNAAKNTPAALPVIIEALQADGYTFLKVSEMLYPGDYRINHEGRQCKT